MGAAKPPSATEPRLQVLRRTALRKAAVRLIPVLALGYLFNYLDRTSVSVAALTMNRDLGLTATQFGWGAGLLFTSYSLFEVPSNLALYRFGARRWMARILVTWGIVAAAQAFAQGPDSFYALRFLLGAAEAGFFPGVVYYLGEWFPVQYRARVLAWFMVASPLSSLVGNPVSGLILQVHGLLGLAGWQWMFIIEGLPACVIGVWALFALKDRPADAHWLSADERAALTDMLDEEHRDRPKSSFLAALRDPRALTLVGITFGFTIGTYGISLWLPQILKGQHLSTVQIGFITAIPYLFATVAMLAWARHVDRTGRRVGNLINACLLSTVGFVFAIAFDSLAITVIAVSAALVGSLSARTLFYTIPARFLTGRGAAGGIAFINCIGALGGFVGPYLVGALKDATGSFKAGMLAIAAALVMATALAGVMRVRFRESKDGV